MVHNNVRRTGLFNDKNHFFKVFKSPHNLTYIRNKTRNAITNNLCTGALSNFLVCKTTLFN